MDPGVYGNLLGELGSAERDAEAMREIADSLGCFARFLRGPDATRGRVIAALGAAIDSMAPGDGLLLTFAGHGVALPGVGNEPDGVAEAWALRDGLLLDDELFDLLSAVPADADVLLLVDACFAAGTVNEGVVVEGAPPADAGSRARRAAAFTDDGRIPPAVAAMDVLPSVMRIAASPEAPDIVIRSGRPGESQRGLKDLFDAGGLPPGPRRRRAPAPAIPARVLTLSATTEAGLAFEGGVHGLFTAALLDVLSAEDAHRVPLAAVAERVAAAVRLQAPSFGRGGGMDARRAARASLASLFPA